MLMKKGVEDLGIELLYRVEDYNKIKLANQMSDKLVNSFPDLKLNKVNLYKKILDTDMYYAKIPNELSKVNYYYKKSSIYFSEDIDFDNIDEFTFHECMHRIQESRTRKGKLNGFGLCEVNELTVKGAALNEGAIQLITSKVLNMREKKFNVYGINMNCKTNYYPLLTSLVNQIVFLLDEDIFVDSVINTNEKFKIDIINNLGEGQYNQIEKNCNELLKFKDNILNIQKDRWDIDDSDEKIEKEIEKIRDIYFKTQDIIFISFFEGQLKRTEHGFEVLSLKEKINKYRKLIGSNSEYFGFDKFYFDFNKRADKRIEELKNKQALTVVKENIFLKIINKIKNLFMIPQKEYYNK